MFRTASAPSFSSAFTTTSRKSSTLRSPPPLLACRCDQSMPSEPCVKNPHVGTHPLRCGCTCNQASFACFNNLLFATQINKIGAVKTEQNIVFFSFNPQVLSILLFNLRFLSPPNSFILKSVKSFFPQNAG